MRASGGADSRMSVRRDGDDHLAALPSDAGRLRLRWLRRAGAVAKRSALVPSVGNSAVQAITAVRVF